LERVGTYGKNTHKINNLEKDDLDIIKSAGVNTGNPDDELSNKCLSLKNIDKELNFSKSEIKSRTYYGFLGKKHKYKNDTYQKRWFFIISSRPLLDINYQNDESQLDEKILPGFLAFDTLYYYECEYDTDISEAKGTIPFTDCHEIQKEDREDNKYYIILDLGHRKYEMQCDYKGERDGWFEALVNSRRTAKEMKMSITKKPRNLSKLVAILEQEGMDKLKDICESERMKCVHGTTEM
jgi:hypothetical protein